MRRRPRVPTGARRLDDVNLRQARRVSLRTVAAPHQSGRRSGQLSNGVTSCCLKMSVACFVDAIASGMLRDAAVQPIGGGKGAILRATSAIYEMSVKDPVAHLHAVAHIWAVREWLPIQPRIEFGEQGIRDRSREDLQHKPPIDAEAVNTRAAEIFRELASKWMEG
jgi:hypothetical protein